MMSEGFPSTRLSIRLTFGRTAELLAFVQYGVEGQLEDMSVLGDARQLLEEATSHSESDFARKAKIQEMTKAGNFGSFEEYYDYISTLAMKLNAIKSEPHSRHARRLAEEILPQVEEIRNTAAAAQPSGGCTTPLQ